MGEVGWGQWAGAWACSNGLRTSLSVVCVWGGWRWCSGHVKGGLQTAADGRMLYAVRSWLVLSHKENPNAQTYLRGHKSPISCLQISVRACDAPDVAPLRTLFRQR